jgi:hypothetical protein
MPRGMSTAVSETSPPPNAAQRAWLARGLDQPGGKLPLFDRNGQKVSPRTVKTCVERGWAEPWFSNPLKPDWLICKLTEEGRRVAAPAKNRRNTGRL